MAFKLEDLKKPAAIVAVTAATFGGLMYLGQPLIEPDIKEPVICEVWHALDITGPWAHFADATSSNLTFSIPGKTNFTIAWDVNMPLYLSGVTTQFYSITGQAGFFKVRNKGTVSGAHSDWNH